MKSTIFSILLIGGLFLTSCQDNCKYNECSFHGACFEGSCLCDEGFYGDQCQHIMEPEAVVIDEINVLELPTFQHWESWDETGGNPDVYSVIRNIDEEYYRSKTVQQDLPYDRPYCEKELGIYLEQVNEVHYLKFYDQDEGAKVDELMGQLVFKPFSMDRGLADVIVIKEDGFSIELHVHYEYSAE